MAKPMEYWKLGAVLAVLGSFVLGMISKLVSQIPGVSLDLQSISVSTTGLGQVVNPGMQKYAQTLFGMLPSQITGMITGMDWIFLAVGGAASLVIGAYAYDKVKMLQFAKGKVGKLATIFVVSGLITGAVLSMSIGIPTLSGAVIMALDALILGVIVVKIDEMTKLGLVPN